MTFRSPNESLVEDVAQVYFSAAGYRIALGADVSPETAPAERPGAGQVILAFQLAKAIRRLNPHLSEAEVEQVVRALNRAPHATLVENNRWFHSLLIDGVEVEYKDAATGENRGGRARLIDFENSANNDFLAVRQLSISGPSR